MRLSAIKRDVARSLRGVWWDFEAGERVDAPNGHLCLLIAEHGNPEHQNRLDALRLLRHVDLRAGGDAAAKARDEIVARALGECVLLGWANMDGDDGLVVPYSAEKATELLLDPSLWELRRFVLDVSRASAFYRQEQEVAAAGN